jgi:type II secretory pathway pseudopilin PulG
MLLMLIMPKLYFYVLGALALIAATIALAAPSLSKGSQWVEQAKLFSDNSAGEYEFAQAVAIDGDTAVVGIPYYGELTDINNAGIIAGEVSQLGETRNIKGYTKDGAAYVYHCSADTCALQAKLFLPKARTSKYSNFGSEVAIDGDTILVAADSPKKDVPELPVYIFTRSGDSWSLQQSHLALPYSLGATYSIKSVALSGDTAIVGVGGRLYVYRRQLSTGTWSYETELPAGLAAIDGNTVIMRESHAVSVFIRDAATSRWSRQAQLASYPRSVRTNVALSEDTAVIGIPAEDSERGAVHVYVRDPATGQWSKQARFVPNDVPPFFQYGFGASVGIDDNRIIVGVSLGHLYSPNMFRPHRVEKAAYLYERDRRTQKWSQPVKLLPQDYKRVASEYSRRVSISGERVILNAGSIGTTDSAYIFRRVDSQKQNILK